MKLEESIWKVVSETISKKAAKGDLTEEQIQRLIDTYIPAITDGLKNFSTSLTETLLQNMPEMLVEHRNMQAAFEERLQRRWKKALDLYDTCVVLGRECPTNCATSLLKS